jgi:hypothetical protein
MKHGIFTTICIGLASSALLVSRSHAKPDDAPKPDADGFYELFDGKSLDNWKVGTNPESWSVADGQIVVHGKGPSHLFYEGPIHNHDWKNFDMKAEVMTFPHANSGIYFHTVFQDKGFPDKGFECQVNCTHSDWKKTGSLYDIVDIRDPHHKDNEWFLYEIIVKDKHVELKIDGKTVNEWTQPEGFVPPKGHAQRIIDHGTMALQGHDPKSETHFKSIRVKPLD